MKLNQERPCSNEEAGRQFVEELLRRFHHDRPDEGGLVVLSEWVLPDQDSMRVCKAAKRR